jgi:hypothetical protein
MQVIRQYLQIRMPLSAQPHLLVFQGFKYINEHASNQAILTDSNVIISATSYYGIPWFQMY